MKFPDLSANFQRILDELGPELQSLRPEAWAVPPGTGPWTRAEILGHLLDSACNNHQRFVRGLSQDTYAGPGYAQDDHVRVQGFREEDPQLLLELVLAFNRHLVWVFSRFPPDKLETPCVMGDAKPMPLAQVALEYVAHFEHHMRQILSAGASQVRWSGMPWPPIVPESDGR